MAIERINLTFNSAMQDKPILQDIGKRYDVVVNIERANISESSGWVRVALTGDIEEIQRATAYLNSLGVFVSLSDDVAVLG
ncbi:MAG: NIL domain-containing protein [Capsulimonadaceae bacterium]